MKICIICQVQNSFEYIPAWLAYHSRLTDHIYLIDHNSEKDLRDLDSDSLTVFRSNMNTYTLDTNINALMAHKKLQDKYDWIFILDIDEFLPFKSRNEILQFCKKYKWYSCVSMYWKNGHAKQKHSKLSSDTAFEFQKMKSTTRKLSYNTRKRRHFWIGHGNHNAQFPVFGIPFINIKPIVKKCTESLYHLPFLNMSVLTQKLESFPKKNFKDKIFRHAQHLEEKYGANWHNKTLLELEKLWLVANYRVVKAEDIICTKNLKFFESHLLKGLNFELEHLKGKLVNCSRGKKITHAGYEADIINEIKNSSKSNYQHTITKYTSISLENQIELVTDKKGLADHKTE